MRRHRLTVYGRGDGVGAGGNAREHRGVGPIAVVRDGAERAAAAAAPRAERDMQPASRFRRADASTAVSVTVADPPALMLAGLTEMADRDGSAVVTVRVKFRENGIPACRWPPG